MKRKNYLITLALTVAILSITGCGNTDTASNNASNTARVEETATFESTEEVQESEVAVNVETETEVVASESVEEVVEEPTIEEPEVEMVDFETWAKQEGNDEVCLVVWNEELGIQEIIPIFQETMKIYTIQVDDKFAIPYNKKIIAIIVNEESYSFSSTDYLEISLEAGKLNQVAIGFKDEQGETQTKNYLLE